MQEELVIIEQEKYYLFRDFLKSFNKDYFAEVISFLEDYLVTSFQYFPTIQGILSNTLPEIYFDSLGIRKSDDIDILITDFLKKFKTELTGFFDLAKFSSIFVSLAAFFITQSSEDETDFHPHPKLLAIMKSMFDEMDNFQETTSQLKKTFIGFQRDAITFTEYLYHWKLLVSVIGLILFTDQQTELDFEDFTFDTSITESLFYIINFSSKNFDSNMLISLYKTWFILVRDSLKNKLDQKNENSAVVLLLSYNALIEQVARITELDIVIADIHKELFNIISNYLLQFYKSDLNDFGGPEHVDFLNEEQTILTKLLIDSAFIFFSQNRQYKNFGKCLVSIWDFNYLIKTNIKTFLGSGILEKFFFIASLWYDKFAEKPPQFYSLGRRVIHIVRKCTHRLIQDERILFLKECYHGMLAYTQLHKTDVIPEEMKQVEKYIGNILIGDEVENYIG